MREPVQELKHHKGLRCHYTLCGGHMRSAARLLRAAKDLTDIKEVDKRINEAVTAINDVKEAASAVALELEKNGRAAPHQMVLGIVGALRGMKFFDLCIPDATVSATVSKV